MPKTLEPILKKHPGIHKGLLFGENPYTPINPNAHSWMFFQLLFVQGLSLLKFNAQKKGYDAAYIIAFLF
jgi:hypothetical protein